MALFVPMQIRTIAIIAEGIPEALTRKLIKAADKKGVTIIGPATVRTETFLLVNPVLIFTSFSPRDEVYPTTQLVCSHTKQVLVDHFRVTLPSSLLVSTLTEGRFAETFLSLLSVLKDFTSFCDFLVGWWDQTRLLQNRQHRRHA